MSLKTAKREELRQVLMKKIYTDDLHSILRISEEFGISRQTIYKYLSDLENEGKIYSEKHGSKKKYLLKDETKTFNFNIAKLEEDIVWNKHIYPVLYELQDNVLRACKYGFTEILNNAIDHSESKTVRIYLVLNPIAVTIWIIDYGIGIFEKIQKAFNLGDPKHSILELAKGKLTTDPERHSGEGIFFTSRIFDKFSIFSGMLSFASGTKTEIDILFDNNKTNEGTSVMMEIEKISDVSISEVFDKYTATDDDYGFSKTYIPVRLVDHEGVLLVSRSQAKRLTARFEKFKEVILDFEGVEEIGQGFADELFRVFAKQHPDVELLPIKMNDKVKKMVYRALGHDIVKYP